MSLFHHTQPEQQSERGPLLHIDHVSIAFDHPVLRDVSFQVREGETVALMGKSGTGKSVLLKLIVGLLKPDSGKVFYRDRDVTTLNESQISTLRSEMGFLFQGAALFDSMTVGQNLELFLVKHTELGSAEREQKILETLDIVGLREAVDKMPSELSGGMKKRAGLARSIVIEPDLMLYDEPTTGLDPLTAASIAEEIVSLQQRLGIASVVVTHDLPTAFTVADRAIVLNEGYAMFDGTLQDFVSSSDPFLKDYLGASKLDRSRHDKIIQAIEEHQHSQPEVAA